MLTLVILDCCASLSFRGFGDVWVSNQIVDWLKTIVISGAKIFTGHQDGKIRVWKVSVKNPGVHKRAGTLPSLKEILKSSIKPSNYIEVKRKRSLWIKHSDAVSCLSLNEEHGLLYSASWIEHLKYGGFLIINVSNRLTRTTTR